MSEITAPHKLPRLYVEAELAAGLRCAFDDGQGHYLRHVMRMGAGDMLRLFNLSHGEWLATIETPTKKEISALITKQLRVPSTPNELNDIWLLASPLKKEAFDVMLEKASELGAARFIPVICDHTSVHRLNEDRLRAGAIQSAEQSERLDVMQTEKLQNLPALLEHWPADRMLIAAIERSDSLPLAKEVNALQGQKLAVLVGPEGGFSEAEKARLLACPFVRPVSLGPLILRAETAAIAALAVVNSVRQH